MTFDIQGAKQAGYSDSEITGFLAQQGKVDLEGAHGAGYSDADILNHVLDSQKPGTVEDVAKSVVGSGLPKGAIGFATLPAEAGNLVAKGEAYAYKKLHNAFSDTPLTPEQEKRLSAIRPFAGTPEARQAVESVTGPLYEPQTTAGKFASAGSEALVGSPMKYLGASLMGGLASEAAGQMSGDNPYARMAAGLLTTGGISGLQYRNGAAGRATAAAMKDITPEQQALADALVKKSYTEGSPVTGAEAIASVTQNPNNKLLALQRVTEDSTKGGPTMQAFMAQRPAGNEQMVGKAVEGVSPVKDFTTIPERAQQAAGGVLTDLAKDRTAATAGLYKQAEEALLDPTKIRPVLDKIDAEILRVGEGSDTAAILKGLKAKIKSSLPDMEPKPTGILDEQGNMISRPQFTNVEQGPAIQIYKETRDQIAKKAEQEGALASSVKGVVKPVNKEFGLALEAQNPALQQANAKYRQITQDTIRPVELSPVGKVAGANPETQGAMTQQFKAIIGSDNATPGEISKAVTQIAAKDGQAARDLVAAGLSNEFKGAVETAKTGSPMYGQQVAGSKWAAALDTPGVKAAVEALPQGQDAYKGLKNAFEILQAQGTRRPAYNSLDAKQALKGGSIAKALNNPTGALGVLWSDMRYGRDTDKLAKLLTNEDSVNGLVKLAKLDPASSGAKFLLANMLMANKSDN